METNSIKAPENTGERQPLSIFAYQNYRLYLKEWYRSAKARSSVVSFRFLSRQAGFQSPNFLKLVMEGQRNLSSDSIDRVLKILKLKKIESEYFRNLVGLNQATASSEREAFAERLLACAPFNKERTLSGSQHNYYAHWYYCPVRELVALPGFQEDAEWVATQLMPPIRPAEARKALTELEDMGLLRRNSSGRLEQADAFVASGDEIASAFLARFHKAMIHKAAEAIDLFPSADREIGGVTVTLSREGAERVRKLLRKVRNEILSLAQDEAAPAGVYQIGCQFYPLTKATKEGSA
jgi:uncharacterized protein (TIGR02147 family)